MIGCCLYPALTKTELSEASWELSLSHLEWPHIYPGLTKTELNQASWELSLSHLEWPVLHLLLLLLLHHLVS